MEKIVGVVESLLKICVSKPLHTGSASYEIEGRLGVLVPTSDPGRTRFEAGIPAVLWESCLKRLALYRHWTRTTPLTHQKDTFHEHPEHGLVRTSLMHSSDGEQHVTHMRKTKKMYVDVVLPEFAHLVGSDGAQFAVRIVLSVERFFHESSLQRFTAAAAIKRVRNKQRANFILHNILEYSLTRVYSGRNALASDAAMDDPPVMEMELECIDIGGMLTHYGNDPHLAAKSFAMKIYNMIDGKDWAPVAAALDAPLTEALEEATLPSEEETKTKALPAMPTTLPGPPPQALPSRTHRLPSRAKKHVTDLEGLRGKAQTRTTRASASKRKVEKKEEEEEAVATPVTATKRRRRTAAAAVSCAVPEPEPEPEPLPEPETRRRSMRLRSTRTSAVASARS